MNIAVFFNSEIRSGGGFQQALSTIKLLEKYKSSKYNFIYFTTKKNIKVDNIAINYIKIGFLKRIHLRLRENLFLFKFLQYFRNSFEKHLLKYDIDLVFFLEPTNLCRYLEDLNYVITVWDLCHRDFLEFPEVRAKREFERRDNLYNKYLKKAIAVLADSNLGRDNIIRRYNVDANRVFVGHFLPSYQSNYNLKTIDVKQKYKITNDYIFYPAQFWAHKNHIYILDALKLLRDEFNISVSAVFTGSDFGNFSNVIKYSEKIGISRQCNYLGFVPNEEIPSLYQQSLALVMPTYFGPTNIPPLEAFALDTVVFYSDLDGLKEQVGEAAILINLNDPMDLSVKLKSLIDGKINRNELIAKGKERLNSWSENDYFLLIKNVIDNFQIKLKCWKG